MNPKWREGFDLYWYDDDEDSTLELTVWDKDMGSKDDFMGRYTTQLPVCSGDIEVNDIIILKG